MFFYTQKFIEYVQELLAVLSHLKATNITLNIHIYIYIYFVKM